jgi:hypothetical protein
MEKRLPELRDWESTRDTLHAYAKVIGAVPRALAQPHPKWWHVSLKVSEESLDTNIFQPQGVEDIYLQLSMDFREHAVKLFKDKKVSYQVSMKDGLSTIDLADELEGHLRSVGIGVQLERAKIEGTSVRAYDPPLAGAYFEALSMVEGVMQGVRTDLGVETGIVNFWPHNFDLAFEWFSDTVIPFEGQNGTVPAQINFGFAPGDSSHVRPYFYSNPWPFDENLTQYPLPSGAQWYLQSWQGSLLAYDTVAHSDVFGELLEEYFLAVFRLASPLLSKDILSR